MLFHYIEKMKSQPQSSRNNATKQFAPQLVSALKQMNNCGVVHRDLTLRNIFLQEVVNDQGGGVRHVIKIADFGLATIDDNTLLKRGTALYMPPEVSEHAGMTVKNANVVDIHATGVILYTLLTSGYQLPLKPKLESTSSEPGLIPKSAYQEFG